MLPGRLLPAVGSLVSCVSLSEKLNLWATPARHTKGRLDMPYVASGLVEWQATFAGLGLFYEEKVLLTSFLEAGLSQAGIHSGT